jgi:hypothetical protein
MRGDKTGLFEIGFNVILFIFLNLIIQELRQQVTFLLKNNN